MYFSSSPVKNKKSSLSQPKNRQNFSQKNTASQLPPTARLILVWLVILAGIIGLGWRLYQLQIKQGSQLQDKARQQQMVNLYPYIPRRSIVDRRNDVVAIDKVVYNLYAHPLIFKEDQEAIAKKLAVILSNQTAEKLLEKFNQQPTGILLERTLNEEQADKIRNLQLDGLELIQRYTRFYPQDELIADILGYVNVDHRGQAGIEYSQQKSLERYLSMLQVRRAGNGAIIPANLPEGIVELDDLQLQLTIDLRLQRAAREALKQQVKKFKAKRGAVIVMDASDGSILSLVCEPTYNPNFYYNYDLELFKNWTITDAYEPGSTFKPINVAIALEAGVIRPNTQIYDAGHVVVDGWNIYNASKVGNGSINITRVLETSSNVGMINIMSRMNKHEYYEQLQELGLGKKMDADLPFEANGYLKTKQVFTARAIEAAVTSFGQGFSLTPLKLVQLHASLANGGKLVVPHVVQGLIDSQGHLHHLPQIQRETQTIFSEATARIVLEMMESVVVNGTGASAQIKGYRIAGKTGTAQKAGTRGGYLAAAKITSFVAILPVNSPRYVVLAVIDEPKGDNTFGSTVAAPVVKEVMESLVSIQGIPPSSTTNH
jgi:cell division protein FtsI (penicillin-binding protein 3)